MKKTNGQSGFSLVEIMIAITILGLVMALVGTNVLKRLDEAKVRTARNQIQIFSNALADFYRENGQYPTTEQGLDALVEQPTVEPVPKVYPEGGYLGKDYLPMDPWNNDYTYESDGRKFEIKSLGSDGQEGGEGIAGDVSSEDKPERRRRKK